MEAEVVGADTSFSRGADAEEENNASHRNGDEPDEEEEEKQEEKLEQHKLERQVYKSSNTEVVDISNTVIENRGGFITCDSDADEIRKLNERLQKTITTLKKRNRTLEVEVKTLHENGSHKIQLMFDEDRKHITDITNLTTENSKLLQKIRNLETSLQMEQKMKMEAEKTVRDLLNDSDARSAPNPILEENIRTLEQKISALQEITSKTHEESYLRVTKIIDHGDHIDGPGIDLKKISESVRGKILRIQEECNLSVKQLEKTVAEKETELINAQQQCKLYSFQNKNYELEIKALKSTIETLNVQIGDMKEQHLRTFSESQEKIKSLEEKIQAMENATKSHGQFDGSLRRMDLEIQIQTYGNIVETLESSIESSVQGKSKDGDNGKGENRGSQTEKRTDLSETHSSYKADTIIKSHQTVVVGSRKTEEEDNNQGHGGSPGTMAQMQGWNGDIDWSKHFDQALQNPDLTPEDQPGSDPVGDNENDDQGPEDSGEDDGSDEDNSDEGQLD